MHERMADGHRQHREALKRRPDCLFVGPDEFRNLLVSNRSLERSDELAARVRGLLDRETGRRFLIEEECLSGEASLSAEG